MSEPTNTPPAVILSIAVNPFQNGKRTIVISGAPAGEMPIVRTGKFSEMHALLDEVWLELNKRKPKVVLKPKASTDTKAKDAADDDSAEEASADADQLKAEADFAETQRFDLSEPQPDQLVHSETAAADEPDAAPLPVIAGDTA